MSPRRPFTSKGGVPCCLNMLTNHQQLPIVTAIKMNNLAAVKLLNYVTTGKKTTQKQYGNNNAYQQR